MIDISEESKRMKELEVGHKDKVEPAQERYREAVAR